MYSGSKTKVSSAETKALGERIASFLRSRHPFKTAENVAVATGLPRSTVTKWLEGAATPGLYAGLKLLDAYGADFVAAAWPSPAGFLADAAREAAKRDLDAQIAELTSRRASL